MASSNAMGKKKMSESSLASLDDPRFDFAIGDQMLCEWREERRQCEIIERRINSMTQQPQYYVHYAEFNRRLDEWVNRDRLHPLEAASSGKKAAGSGSGKKLKIDPSLTISHLSGPSAHDDATAGELDAATQREHEAATRVKNVNKVVLGKWEMQTWYFSPFPKEYSECDTLYFCEYDLHFCRSRDALIRYQKRKEASGDAQHPPGNEIYRSGEISVFECDGVKCRTYCQNLCLLAKLFLDHKTCTTTSTPSSSTSCASATSTAATPSRTSRRRRSPPKSNDTPPLAPAPARPERLPPPHHRPSTMPRAPRSLTPPSRTPPPQVQSRVHPDAAAAPAEGVRPLPDLVLVRALAEGGARRHAGAPALRPRHGVVPLLLGVRPPRHPPGAPPCRHARRDAAAAAMPPPRRARRRRALRRAPPR